MLLQKAFVLTNVEFLQRESVHFNHGHQALSAELHGFLPGGQVRADSSGEECRDSLAGTRQKRQAV